MRKVSGLFVRRPFLLKNVKMMLLFKEKREKTVEFVMKNVKKSVIFGRKT